MLYSFDNCMQDYNHVYGGHSAQKMGIIFNNGYYMLKYPNNLKEKKIRNCSLSYSNSPYSEYIGSHIYDILGIPVHETLLGTRKNHIVVACRNFCDEDERLMMFSEIKTTFEPSNELAKSNSATEGGSVELNEILQVLEEHPLFSFDRDSVKRRFWDMFIIDAYIGNPDRNNENWGIITGRNGKKRLAPVYDNGNSLCDKWDTRKTDFFLNCSKDEQIDMAFSIPSIYKEGDKRIFPLNFIEKRNNNACNEAMLRIFPQIITSQDKIKKMIDTAPSLDTEAKNFYWEILNLRFALGLLPAFIKIYKEHYGNEYILADSIPELIEGDSKWNSILNIQ